MSGWARSGSRVWVDTGGEDGSAYLAPGVTQVRVLVECEAVGDDLGEHLNGKDRQVDPLARVHESHLPRAWRVERRNPCHGDAVGEYGHEDDWVEGRPLDEVYGTLPRLVVHLSEGASAAVAVAGTAAAAGGRQATPPSAVRRRPATGHGPPRPHAPPARTRLRRPCSPAGRRARWTCTRAPTDRRPPPSEALPPVPQARPSRRRRRAPRGRLRPRNLAVAVVAL